MTYSNEHKYRQYIVARKGFTIVELVIVVAVIGILAALGVIGLGTWRTHVAETEVSSNISGVQAGMEDALNRRDAYPVFPVGTEFDGSNDSKSIFIQSEYVTVTYARGSGTSYCIDVRSKAVSSVYMSIDTAGGNRVPQKVTC